MRARIILSLLMALALVAIQAPPLVSARTLYIDAARVYLPKLRRLLSFGGFLNQQAQDTVVSLDLSVPWKIASPAMTVLPTGLGEPTAAMIPHVTRADDGTYTILLYPSQPPAQGKAPKQFRITTKDGKKLDSIVPSELPASAWAPVFSCFSSTASVLTELFNDPSIPGDANGYFFGGYPKGTNDTTKANATEVTAEINLRNSGNLVTALPTGSRNPSPSSSCALGFIGPKKVMMQRAPASGAKSVAVLSLLNMQWGDYAGQYPEGAIRRGNQFVPYASPSGRSYVLSVGSDWRTGPNNQVFSSIWYSDMDGEKPWVNASVTRDPQILYRHGALVVDDQVVLVGHTDDISAAQAATAAAVFKIVEPSPGTLEFQGSDEFVPKAVSGAGDANSGDAAKSGPSIAVIAGGAVAGLAVLAVVGFVVYRRRQPSGLATKTTSGPSSPSPPTAPAPAPAVLPIDPEAAELDELLFATPVGGPQQHKPWTSGPYQAQAAPPPMMPVSEYPATLPQPDLVVDPKMQAFLEQKDAAAAGGYDPRPTDRSGPAGPVLR